MAASFKLYTLPGACSLATHIVLAEGNFDYEIIKVTKTDKGLMAGEVLLTTLSPIGRVPVLLAKDGKVWTEDAVILRYLQTLSPEKLYFPTEGDAKWKALSILNFIATDLHKGMGLFAKPYFCDADKDVHKKADCTRNLSYLNQLLDGKKYLFADEPSIADFYAYVVSSWSFNRNVDISEFQNIIDFGKRIEARPAVQKALKEANINPRFN